MFFGGLEPVFILLPVVLIGLILLGLLVFGTIFRGADADPKGRRPLAIYLLVVMVVSLFTVVGSAATIGGTLVRDAVTDDSPTAGGFGPGPSAPQPIPIPGPSFDPGAGDFGDPFGGSVEPLLPFDDFGPQESTLADVLEALVLGLVALIAYLVHRRWFEDLLIAEGDDG